MSPIVEPELVSQSQNTIESLKEERFCAFKQQKESQELLQELLKKDRENDIKHGGFKINHNAHALCSLYDVGAPPKYLKAFYEKSKKYLEPPKQKKFEINESNLKDHISDPDAYQSYLVFFDAEVEKLGILETFKKYLPGIIPGVAGAALHPLIHLGYVIEFKSKIIASEALALSYSDYWEGGELISKIQPKEEEINLFKELNGAIDIERLSLQSEQPSPISHTARLIFEELPKLGAKPVSKDESGSLKDNLNFVATNYGSAIIELCSKWACTEDTICQHERDLSIGIVEIYGGSFRGSTFDFFLLHNLTGLHGTRTLLPILDKPDQVRLLNLTFAATVLLFLTQGGPMPTKASLEAPKEIEDGVNSQKAWNHVVFRAIESLDAHLIKGVRNLYQLQQKYGKMGDIFFRAAAHSALTIPENGWTFHGIGHLRVDAE